MATENPTDPFDLNRFVEAQAKVYATALLEIRRGEKCSHWMWFIFPQIDGLAESSTSKYFAIKSLKEAQAYLAHPVLGARLRQCAEAVMTVEGRSAYEIFGDPDELKLRSCATLFGLVSPAGSVFHCLLDKYYGGVPDEETLSILS